MTHCLKTPEQSLHDQDHLEVPLGLLGLGFLRSPLSPCTSWLPSGSCYRRSSLGSGGVCFVGGGEVATKIVTPFFRAPPSGPSFDKGPALSTFGTPFSPGLKPHGKELSNHFWGDVPLSTVNVDQVAAQVKAFIAMALADQTFVVNVMAFTWGSFLLLGGLLFVLFFTVVCVTTMFVVSTILLFSFLLHLFDFFKHI